MSYRSLEQKRELQNRWCKDKRREYRRRLHQIKSERGCERGCGETHPAALDFHHRDPASKKHKVSDLTSRIRSWQVIEDEIAKCDVVCANCHRKEHYREY